MNARSRLTLGTAPDSWGVWFPSWDPGQIPWPRYLDEIVAAGYRASELGPTGYLPTDGGWVRDEFARRGLTLTGGTVVAGLQRGSDALIRAKVECDVEMDILRPSGARHVVILPEPYTDDSGRQVQPPTLSDDGWANLTSGISELGRYLADRHDAILVFHPHADSHVGTHEEIVRLLESTDPECVQLCLDTGHAAYCGADSLALIRDVPDRIGYVHLKQVDPAILGRVREEELAFAPAVRLGVMVEPPTGEPDMAALIHALARLERDLFCIVEQDLYPCASDVPLPIATRTRVYLESIGLAGPAISD